MAQSKRILFVAGEVAPFAEVSSIAELARSLPEKLQEAGDYEARIMMPCYGSISEREHSLHEVIRLSGTDVPMGDETETVTVKVASVPGVRLQVYFMDHDGYFGRDGLAHDADGDAFEDNDRRALFFDRAVLETIRKLRWGPDVIHSFGWISGLVPLLLASEYTNDDVLSQSQIVYTPDTLDLDVPLSADFVESMNLSVEEDGSTLSEIGQRHAGATIFPSDLAPTGDASQFSDDPDEHGEQLVDLYEQMLREVPA
jgi:starch synthase